jgi:hypothetical protein
MPKRIPLVAGILIASTTAVYAVRPPDRGLNPFQIDMKAAEFCQDLATDAARRYTIDEIVREKIVTVPSRYSERQVSISISAFDHDWQHRLLLLRCHVSCRDDGILLIDLEMERVRVGIGSAIE